jgi:type IV pilus assembly protein PilB
MLSVDQKPPVLKKRFLGTILIEHNLITSYQLRHVLEFQEKQGGQIGEILVDLGYIQERDVVMALVIQSHVPYIAIDQYEIDQNVIRLVPKDIAYKYRVVPLDRMNRILSIVMSDPLDTEANSDLQNITNCRLVPFIATHREIEKAIHRWYGY